MNTFANLTEPESYSCVTSLTSFERLAVASPNSMLVFSSKNSSFSIPANPVFIERLSTITDFAALTRRRHAVDRAAGIRLRGRIRDIVGVDHDRDVALGH